MPSVSPQTVKLKSTLRLLIPRLRNAQKKDTALSVAARREMAELLAQHREASARIRVENIIHADITVELMEILELYAELLLARAGLLDMRDKAAKESGAGLGVDDSSTGLEEAAASIIYAAPRLPRDVRELGVVRGMLIERFGKEFAVRANENQDDIVPRRVVDKLRVDPPGERLVQLYLEEIARTYGVDWPPRTEEEGIEELRREVDDDDDNDDENGGSKEAPILADGAAAATTTPRPGRIDMAGLNRATPPSGLGTKSPVSVAPPGARSDNLSPSVKLPGGGEVGKSSTATGTGASAASAAKGKAAAGGGGGGGLGSPPTVDDLARRFASLKR